MTSASHPAVLETHVSYVFLIGDRAYKLKKPVSFDFVDQSTTVARQRLCHREVELNRRLAPDIYLGVLDVVDSTGRPVDHLVEMRRMPDDRRLSALVGKKVDVDGCLRRLARDLAAFHSGAATSPEIARRASLGHIRRNWEENLRETEGFVGRLLDPDVFARIGRRAHRYLDGRRRLFSARAVDAHAKDGHGDLLADDIFCLEDGPRILDCIEFSDELRWGDVVADVAFLAMDLERLGSRPYADRFLAWYREFSGESYPSSLADHYVAFRALIRSKVACLKHDQGDAAARDPAQSLLGLCDRRLDDARVRVVLVGGLPGTGKSTLAAGMCGATGFALLRSDEVRKDITGTAHTPQTHPFAKDIYDDATTDRTYRELLNRARALLETGTSVVLDASWIRERHREQARRVADESSSDIVAILCEIPPDAAEQRMKMRRASGLDASDADAAVASAMARRMDPWPLATTISTAGAVEDVIRLGVSYARTITTGQ